MAILQITGRRGKAKKKHPKSSPIRAVQCPTKCHNFVEGNTVDSQLVREVKPGQFLAETRVATHCDVRIFVFVLCVCPLDQNILIFPLGSQMEVERFPVVKLH